MSTVESIARPRRNGERRRAPTASISKESPAIRSEERFSRNAETDLVCRLLLEKKKIENHRQTQAQPGYHPGQRSSTKPIAHGVRTSRRRRLSAPYALT